MTQTVEQDLVMNGPVCFDMSIFVYNEKTDQYGRVRLYSVYFEYPTPETIAKRVLEFERDIMPVQHPGFRLMKKKEAFQAVMLEKTGQLYELQGTDDWDKID